MWIVYYILYLFLSYRINLKFEYSDGYELLIGTLITTIVLYILDAIFYKFAFDFTGYMRALIDSSRNEMKLIHWFIRSLLLLIVYAVSFTPLPSIILSPLIHSAYEYIKSESSALIKSVSDTITDSILRFDS